MFLVNLEGYLRGEAVGFSCQALHGSCFVSADGQLYPCHLYDRPVGSLREWGFDVAALWASQEVLHAREDVVALRCGGCFAAFVTGGMDVARRPARPHDALAASRVVPRAPRRAASKESCY
jgi:radical SAM protein with 4Fe4S-binding SPASM domain